MNSLSVRHGSRTQSLDVSKWEILEERTGAAGEKVIKFQDPAGTIINANETTEKNVFNIHKEKPTNTKAEIEHSEDAEKILNNPQLLQILKKEVAKKVVGEEDTIHTIIIVAAGGLYIKDQTPPTYTLVTNSRSNAGKDFTVSKTLELFPHDKVIRRTRISERALTYMHNSKYEPEWTWDNKILYLSDVSNNVLNCEVVKCMVTEGSSATIVINHMAIDIEIKGKPCIIGTIAKASPSEETLGRFPFMSLDESAEQTKEIMKRQATAAAKGKNLNTAYDQDILNALKLLEPVNVVIPFAEKLPEYFTDKMVIMRRNFDRILKYISASAALHQKQRQKDEFGSIIAEPADYENARIALKKIASNAAFIPLTREDKKIIEYALTVESFTTLEVSSLVNLEKTALYEHLDKLVENGLLIVQPEQQGFGRPINKYRAAVQEEYVVNIPTWAEIEKTYSAFSTYSVIPERLFSQQDTTEQPKNNQNVALSGKSGQAELKEKTEITEKVFVTNVTPLSPKNSLLDEFRDLWKGKIKFFRQPLPIEVVQKKLPLITDDVLSIWKQRGDIIESPAGWVMPL